MVIRNWSFWKKFIQLVSEKENKIYWSIVLVFQLKISIVLKLD